MVIIISNVHTNSNVPPKFLTPIIYFNYFHLLGIIGSAGFPPAETDYVCFCQQIRREENNNQHS